MIKLKPEPDFIKLEYQEFEDIWRQLWNLYDIEFKFTLTKSQRYSIISKELFDYFNTSISKSTLSRISYTLENPFIFSVSLKSLRKHFHSLGKLLILKYENIAKPKPDQVSKDNHYSINFEIPNEFKIPLQQYFLFFKEFVSVSKRVKINVEIKEHETGIAIDYEKNENLEIELWCQEYIDFFRSNLNNSSPKIDSINTVEDVKPNEVNYLILKLENEVAHLKNSVKILQVENKLLLHNNEFLQKLSLALSSNNPKITNQLISGGSQQFSDNIQNI